MGGHEISRRDGGKRVETQKSDHLVSEEKEKRGESQVEMAMGTLQKVMWNCPSLLMKWREEESLEMESSIRVRLAMWCPGEETDSEVRHTCLLLPSTM